MKVTDIFKWFFAAYLAPLIGHEVVVIDCDDSDNVMLQMGVVTKHYVRIRAFFYSAIFSVVLKLGGISQPLVWSALLCTCLTAAWVKLPRYPDWIEGITMWSVACVHANISTFTPFALLTIIAPLWWITTGLCPVSIVIDCVPHVGLLDDFPQSPFGPNGWITKKVQKDPDEFGILSTAQQIRAFLEYGDGNPTPHDCNVNNAARTLFAFKSMEVLEQYGMEHNRDFTFFTGSTEENKPVLDRRARFCHFAVDGKTKKEYQNMCKKALGDSESRAYRDLTGKTAIAKSIRLIHDYPDLFMGTLTDLQTRVGALWGPLLFWGGGPFTSIAALAADNWHKTFIFGQAMTWGDLGIFDQQFNIKVNPEAYRVCIQRAVLVLNMTTEATKDWAPQNWAPAKQVDGKNVEDEEVDQKCLEALESWTGELPAVLKQGYLMGKGMATPTYFKDGMQGFACYDWLLFAMFHDPLVLLLWLQWPAVALLAVAHVAALCTGMAFYNANIIALFTLAIILSHSDIVVPVTSQSFTDPRGDYPSVTDKETTVLACPRTFSNPPRLHQVSHYLMSSPLQLQQKD